MPIANVSLIKYGTTPITKVYQGTELIYGAGPVALPNFWEGATSGQFIEASDKAVNDSFGYSQTVSGDGNVCAIFAIGEDTGGDHSGTVYIYKRSGNSWTEVDILYSSNPKSYGGFGYRMAMDFTGSTLAISAPGEDHTGISSGAVYIYEHDQESDNWNESHIITRQFSFRLGQSIAMDQNGTRLSASANYNTSGTVAIFRKDASWVEEAAITGSSSTEYGKSLAMNSTGDRIVAGASKEDRALRDEGVVYILERNGTAWQELAIPLEASDAELDDMFGSTVDISGDGTRIIVGAPQHNTLSYSNAGKIYVFDKNGETWTETTSFTHPTPSTNKEIGKYTKLSGDGRYILSSDPHASSNQGEVYLWYNSEGVWTFQQTLADTEHSTEFFGRFTLSISDNGDTIIAGADAGNPYGTDYGSAYVFMAGEPHNIETITTLPTTEPLSPEIGDAWYNSKNNPVVWTGTEWTRA